MPKCAIVQQAPVLMDKQKTIATVVAMIEQAAGQDANLVIFPEAFIPGYPSWIWRLRPGNDWGLSETLHQRLLDNAVDLTSDDLDRSTRQRKNIVSLSSAVSKSETQRMVAQPSTTRR